MSKVRLQALSQVPNRSYANYNELCVCVCVCVYVYRAVSTHFDALDEIPINPYLMAWLSAPNPNENFACNNQR